MDPANNLDFWLSSGSSHVWHPNQPSPATPWEKTIDDLMRRQTTAPTLRGAPALFADVQQDLRRAAPGDLFRRPEDLGRAEPPRRRRPAGPPRSESALERGHALRHSDGGARSANRSAAKTETFRRAPSVASIPARATARGDGARVRGRVRRVAAGADGAG